MAETSKVQGLVDKAKEAVAKVAGMIKKDDGGNGVVTSPAADADASENAQKMKAAVDAARKTQDEG